MRDQFWDDLYPELPYTVAAEETRTDPILGGTANYHVPTDEAEFLPLSISDDSEEDDNKNHHNLSEVVIGNKRENPISRQDSVDSGSGIQIKARPSSKPIKISPKNGEPRYSEFGSLLSVDKPRHLMKSSANSASGVSLVSRLHAVLRGRGGPGSVLSNSHMSLMSRNSRNRGGQRSRKQSSNLARSISRVSNASASAARIAGRHPSGDSNSEEEEESMFKFSSMSSIDHLQGSASDLATKKRKKYSISNSGIQSPKASKAPNSPGIPRRQSENQKIIVRKLELMHNFTSEAVRLLKKEENLEEFDILRALEENHEELRRLLLKRLKTKVSTPSAMTSPTSEQVFDFEEAIDNLEPENQVQDNKQDDEESVEEPTVLEVLEPQNGDSNENENDTSDPPFDLATIEEQPELGYQSDSEAYENTKKNSKEKVSKPLDTLAEDIIEENDKD